MNIKKLSEKTPLTSMSNVTDVLVMMDNGQIEHATLDAFRAGTGSDQSVSLLQNAFYTEPNNAAAAGSKYITVGGNDEVRKAWCDNQIPILLDPKTGYYCRLNESDMRFTADGVQVFDGSAVTSAFANAEWMGIIPAYHQLVKDELISGVTHNRVWAGFNELGGSKQIAQQCVGMFKAYIASSKMHSRPGVQPSANFTVYNGWQNAQNTDPKCGLAGIQFRTYLMQLLNAKYGYRSSQEVTASGGSLVYGVGLDGTESTATGESVGDVGFSRQSSIKTGATLAGGKRHGNAAVTDTQGNTCHSVIMGVFENPWGQYWEFVGDLCSLASDEANGNRVIHMLENTMPKSGSSFITAPKLADFAHIQHEILTRASAGDKTFVNAANNIYQALPIGSGSGIDDGDYMWYAATGQVWIWGGDSGFGARCGLGSSRSNYAWTFSYSNVSARLAYFGDLHETTSDHLKTLLAS